MFESTFSQSPAEKPALWQEWLDKYDRSEPLVLLIDDEEAQRNIRYYQARMYHIPSRNILLFANAAEAIAFIAFAKENELTIAGIMTDYDNGALSPENGNKVLEATFGKWPEALRYMVSSEERKLSDAVNDYNVNEGKKNPAQFYEKGEDDKVEGFFKALSNVDHRGQRTGIFKDVARDQEDFIPLLKQHLDIAIYYEQLFTSQFAEYAEIQPAGHRQTIGESYSKPLETIAECKKTILELIKLNALIKQYEQGSKKALDNPDGQSPTEPILVRTLGEFTKTKLLELKKRMQHNAPAEILESDRYERVRVAAIEEFMSEPDWPSGEEGAMAAAKKASHIVHALCNVSYGIRKNIDLLIDQIDHFEAKTAKEAQKRTWWRYCQEFFYPLHRFTHETLKDVMRQAEVAQTVVSFGYVKYEHKNRPANIPGNPAPLRKELVLVTEENRAHVGEEHQSTLDPQTARAFFDLVSRDKIRTSFGQGGNLVQMLAALKGASIS